MINTQTQIDSLIDLAVIQRKELKQLVESLPQLRDHLSSEIERNLEEIEPSIRSELEQFVAARALDAQAKTSAELGAKIEAMARNLESTTAARYSVIMAERAENANLLAKAEARIAEAASALPAAVKTVVADELSRFPRAGEIDQLRKEFAEPRGLNPRGRWEAGVTYYKLDLVAYNGDSYVANEETKDKPSRASTKWTLNAARGNAGGGSFVNPTAGDYTAAMITNVPSGTISATNVQDAIDELASEVVVSQNTLDATVTNAESVAITKGQVVYAFSATGNRMSVKLALNTADATSAKTIGVVADTSIAAGGVGTIRCVGVLDGLTLGSYSDGDTLYLGATAGSVTATKPYAPNHLVYVGIVERANNGNGELYVRIQNGYELDEIHDVQITSAPLAGALLMRDATNSLWKANRLTGTAGQVTVTNADTSVTLSLPTALTSIDSVTASATTNLTLSGGSSGASLVLGQGASGGASIIRNVSFGDTGLLGASWGTGATAIGRNGNDKVILGYLLSTTNGATIGAHNSALGAWTDFNYNALQHTWRLSEAAAMRLSATNGNLLIGGTTDITGTGGLKVFGTTAATNTTSGALQVAGGAGIAGATWIGGRLNVSSAFSIPGRFESSDINASIQIHSTATGANSSGYQLVSGGTGSVAGAGGFGIYDSGAGAIRMTISSTGAFTFAGLVSTPAATATTAGLRVPHGAAPTSPVNGDIWTTTAGLFVRINGVTVGPLT